MEVWPSPVYGTCLENRRTEMFREFESHRFRHIKTHFDAYKVVRMASYNTVRDECVFIWLLESWVSG